jgi:hypothetical protein
MSKRILGFSNNDMKSEYICKNCNERIPQYQVDRFKTYGLYPTFCRDYINRKECFPKFKKNLKKKERDFIFDKFVKDNEEMTKLKNIKELNLDDCKLVDLIWESELMKQQLMEKNDGEYFNDLEYFPLKDKKIFKKMKEYANINDNKNTNNLSLPCKIDKYNDESIRIKKEDTLI